MTEYYSTKNFIYKIEDGKIYRLLEKDGTWHISSFFKSKKTFLNRKDIKFLTLLDLAMLGVFE